MKFPRAPCYDAAVNPTWAEDLRLALKVEYDAGRLTLTKVAKLAGVSQPAVSQFLKFKGRTPEVPIFMAACQLLHLDPYEVVGVSSPVRAGDYEADQLPASTTEDSLAFLRRLTSALVDLTARESRQQTTETRAHAPRRRKRNRTHRG